MKNTKLFSTRNSISEKNRSQIIDLLNQLLADASDLYSHIKQAHWNLKGKTFMQIHLLLDDMAEDVEKQIDEIAERVTQLGGVACGTVRMAAKASRLPEYPIQNHQVEDHLKTLADDFGTYANALREGIDQADDADDAGSADLLTQSVRVADKALWILESHLESSGDESSHFNNGKGNHKRLARN